MIRESSFTISGNAVYAYPRYRNSNLPAGEDISAQWNTGTSSYNYEGNWDD